jgi:hypothetical protein
LSSVFFALGLFVEEPEETGVYPLLLPLLPRHAGQVVRLRIALDRMIQNADPVLAERLSAV